MNLMFLLAFQAEALNAFSSRLSFQRCLLNSLERQRQRLPPKQRKHVLPIIKDPGSLNADFPVCKQLIMW